MGRLDDVIEPGDGAVVISVHVQPGAGRSALVGRHGSAVKVRVAAPPVDGRANDAVAELLAEALGTTAGAVAVVSGARSRAKRFRVEGLDLETARERLDLALEAVAARTPPAGRRKR